ncbi:DegT/DnrJ/EryC1/StrS aminotransferase family protein [Frankia sp. Cr1]|uniref:DegT/DnrJ/EryC1/StrS family aminotransferase n=1 Tax=Frankia sp. Cr1 TaxID=3073931 RepID=UPI002AD35CB7|nr:DegT/DnrJ/EryC1/StrS aminotransferase family protein [Frankia sp. Cr1]
MSTEVLDTAHPLLDETDSAAVMEALSTRDLSGTAPVVATYERALGRTFGVGHAVACSSGTAAIHLALLAHGIGPGDEVIVPATAPVMTAMPVLAVGARPVFADVADSASFALSLPDVQSRLSPRTRAIISVAMWGYPADGDALAALCARHGLILVEDAAQAHGSRTGDRLVGTRGRVGALSTHERKLINTGEGGFLLTDDTDMARRLVALRNAGKIARGEEFGRCFGLNFKLPALSAALGVSQLARFGQRLATRRVIQARLAAALAGVAGVTPFPVRDGTANGYAVLFLADDPAMASLLGEGLGEAGFVSDPHRYAYRPLYRYDAFADIPADDCPNATALCSLLVSLPCHEGVAPTDEQRMISTIRRVLES